MKTFFEDIAEDEIFAFNSMGETKYYVKTHAPDITANAAEIYTGTGRNFLNSEEVDRMGDVRLCAR